MQAVKIVWLTDLHLTESGMVEGVACKARLAQAVEQIARHHADAVACVVTGDLTDTGGAAEYAVLRDGLAGLPMPLLPLAGNHDKRAALRAVFPPPGEAMAEFQQFRWDTGGLTLLCLDTVSPGEDGGRIDAARLDWLWGQLVGSAGRRVLVFMHHPPGPLGLGLLDDMPLHDSGPLIDRLMSAPQVEHLFCGHVHRPVSGVIGGIPFTTLRALAHQTRPGHEVWDWSNFTAPDERPQYGVILVGPDRIVVQANDLKDPA